MTNSVTGSFSGTFRPFDIGAGIFALVGTALCYLATQASNSHLQWALFGVGVTVILTTLGFWCWQRAKLPQEDTSRFVAALPNGQTVEFTAPPKDTLYIAKQITKALEFRGATPVADGEMVRVTEGAVPQIRAYSEDERNDCAEKTAVALSEHDKDHYELIATRARALGNDQTYATS